MLALSELFALQRRAAMLTGRFRRLGLKTDGRFAGPRASSTPYARRQERRLAGGGREYRDRGFTLRAPAWKKHYDYWVRSPL